MATGKDGDEHRAAAPSSTENTATSGLTPDRPATPRSPFFDPDIPAPEEPPWYPDGNRIHGFGPPPPLPLRPPWAPPPQNPTPPEPILPITPDHIPPPDPPGSPYPDIPPFSPFALPGPPQPLIPPFPPNRGGLEPPNRYPQPCPPDPDADSADSPPGGHRTPPNLRFPPPGRGPTYLSFDPQNAPKNLGNFQGKTD